MKLNIFALVALLLPSAAALDCGGALTTDCVSDSDIRYDLDAGYDLQAESAFWKRIPGLYRGFESSYRGDPPRLEGNETRRLTYFNISVSGSRVSMHTYQFAGGIGLEAFGQGLSKTDNSVELRDEYSVSTFNKDGSTIELGRHYNYGPRAGKPFRVGSTDFTTLTVDSSTRYGSGQVDGVINSFAQETAACLGDKSGPCSNLQIQLDLYSNIPELSLYQLTRLTSDRMDERNWLLELSTLISTSDMAGELDPVKDGCATKLCPTEEQWQEKDPYFNASPYQEPDASLTGGGVALLVVLAVLVVGGIGVFIYKERIKNHEEKLKKVFAESIAATMAGRISSTAVTPDDLRKEFDLIDADHGGSISKEEFRTFIDGTDKVHLDDRDFDVLYNAIDLDGDHEIDFSEFCAFFAIIRKQYDAAIAKGEIKKETNKVEIEQETNTVEVKQETSKVEEPKDEVFHV